MQLEITVRAVGEHWCGGACIKVPEPLQYAFEPVKTTDEPLLVAFNSGAVMRGSDEVRRKLKLREEAAKELAEALTRHLLCEMQKHDTHNGYNNSGS